jgi:hypothetical protein
MVLYQVSGILDRQWRHFKNSFMTVREIKYPELTDALG